MLRTLDFVTRWWNVSEAITGPNTLEWFCGRWLGERQIYSNTAWDTKKHRHTRWCAGHIPVTETQIQISAHCTPQPSWACISITQRSIACCRVSSQATEREREIAVCILSLGLFDLRHSPSKTSLCNSVKADSFMERRKYQGSYS